MRDQERWFIKRETERRFPLRDGPQIVARVSAATQARLKHSGVPAELHFCETVAEVARASLRAPACIVWEVLPSDAARVELIPPEIIPMLSKSLPIVRVSVSRAHVRSITRLAEAIPELHVSLNGFDDLLFDIRQALNGDFLPEAYPVILPTLGDAIGPSVEDVVAAAVIVGRRRMSVGAFLARCGLKPRAVQRRLCQSGLPTLRGFLAWSMILHSVWRMEVLGFPAKRVADLAGYSGPGATAALSELLNDHLGFRLRASCEPGTFAELMRQFGKAIRGASGTSAAKTRLRGNFAVPSSGILRDSASP